MLAGMNLATAITGASRGIGRGIALELARLGSDLVLGCARNLEAARQTAADCVSLAGQAGKSIRVEICQADLGSGAGRQRPMEVTRSALGRLDVLVNNAGVAPEPRADILEA